MTKYVIIGAGQTGRGYINRLLFLNGENTVFLDSDPDKVDLLADTAYEVSFGADRREKLTIGNYTVLNANTQEALQQLAEADFVFTAIGANNLVQLIVPFKHALAIRQKKEPMRVVTCENGVGNSLVLEGLKQQGSIEITEGIVFCTTLERGKDILSENLDWIPYDATRLSELINLRGFSPDDNLPVLMQRKIYTYNCLSAVVAYLGYILGYDDYAEAANDQVVVSFMEKIRSVIDRAVSTEFSVPLDEQHSFSKHAVEKFRNKEIKDTIDRNTRDSKRKLSENERLIAPLKLISKHGLASQELLSVCACACFYGMRQDGLDWHEVTDLLHSLPEDWQSGIIEEVRRLNHGENILG